MTPRLTPAEGAMLVALARAAIEEELFRNGALAAARSRAAITAALASPRACFVTLKRRRDDGALELRGCIGSTEARVPAHDAVVAAALSAAFEDPRFPRLTREEHPSLVVSISALAPPAQISGADLIVPGRDGVVLECDGRRALFLPEVAEDHGWTVDELLGQLARKAGLPADAWRRARLFTFDSERFGEDAGGAARIRRS